ncbi:MAG: DUF6671 family protein [Asticcacaulis sp.]|uniref:DUF6671 family protein n=1 Tax=Asticcacaulis sp. TaxID=1872648 RepID=UPI003F7B947E
MLKGDNTDLDDYLGALQDAVAVLTTSHQKEDIIAPIMAQAFGLIVGVTYGVDTDRFGAFSGEVERSGTALDALRLKIDAGFDYTPRARFGLASEGSFSPDRQIGVLATYEEIVMFVDREWGIEVCGYDVGFQTNYASLRVTSPRAAFEFALRCGFPEHAMIVSASPEHAPRPDLAVFKGLKRHDALETRVRDVVKRFGAAFVQTDMRAHMNPTRRLAIAHACEDLVRRLRSPCPQCGHPDFSMRRAFGGRPCQICRSETLLPRYRRYQCLKCGHYRQDEDACPADPAHCPDCNP